MNEFYMFHGRATQTVASESMFLLESAEGTVLEIIEECHGISLTMGYCREAIADRWGVFCENPFICVSDSSGKNGRAKYHPEGWSIYKAVRIDLVREEHWMKVAE